MSTSQHKFNRANPFSHSWDISRQSFYSYWCLDISVICCCSCTFHICADSPHLGLSSATWFVKIGPLVVEIQAEWSLWQFTTFSVVATTRRNSTRSLLTSAKLSVGYLVVGIYKRTQQGALTVLLLYLYKYNVVRITTMCLPHVLLLIHHVFSLRPPCFLHVLWHHTLNLRCTCAHHMYTIRNLCLLTSLLTLTPFRLFPILLDPKSFQTALAFITWLPGHVSISYLSSVVD